MKQTPQVSCHGILRFMQRIEGLDADCIRSYLARRRNCQITQVTDYEILKHLRHTRRNALKRAIREISRLLERRGVRAAQRFAGSHPYKICVEGIVFCVNDGNVVTCFPAKRRMVGLQTATS